MANLIDFPPLFTESLDKIRARMNADANAGLSPQDPSYLDTTAGGFFYDLTQAPALEIERLYDSLNEIAAAMFLAFAWGVYLDLHGLTIQEVRKGATAATGVVTFYGGDGTVIPTGTQVSTQQVSAAADQVVFLTTQDAVVVGGLVNVLVQAVRTGADSNAAAGAVQVLLSPVDSTFGGISAVTNASPITGGSDVETDEAFRARLLVAFAGAHGAGTIDDYIQWALSESGVGYVKVEPLWAGDGTVRVIITDEENNTVAPSVITSLQSRLDPPSVATTLAGDIVLPVGTLPLTSTGGLLPAGRLVLETTDGSKTVVVSYTGVSGSTVTGVTGGTGTFPTGSYVMQQGLGHGLAPIGAVVVVATPIPVPIDAQITLTLASGFTLDGAGGAPAVAPAVEAAVLDYLNTLSPGDPVVYQAVVARIMDTNGVADITDLGLTRQTLDDFQPANIALQALEVAIGGSVEVQT